MTFDEFIFKNLRQMVELCREGDTRHLDVHSKRLPRKLKNIRTWQRKQSFGR